MTVLQPLRRSRFLGSDHVPGLMYVDRQFLVVYVLKLDSNPSAHSNVGWLEIGFGVLLDELLLQARGRREPYRDAAMVVMVVGKHGENLLIDEKRWLAVRNFLAGSRKSKCYATHAAEMLAVKV